MVVIFRKIRSFVRREGRSTPGQRHAFTQHWARFGIHFPAPTEWIKSFVHPAPLALDIGFGNGESVVTLARAHPDWNIIAIEVYRPGIGNLFRQLVEHNIHNVRVFCHDAVEVLHTAIPPASLQHVQIFFPDPWQKKRHHKRRLIQPEFVALIADRLQPQGELLLATDWQNYAEHMQAILSGEPLLRNTSEEPFSPRDLLRPVTKFESRGQQAGHGVWDLRYVK